MTITSVSNFFASGMSSGIKPSGAPDLALITHVDGKPVTAAGVFTSNKMTAAPVQICKEFLSETGGQAAAVIINSGNANAATGEQGKKDARTMASLTAEQIGCRTQEVLVCSTGWIGYPLPIEKIKSSIPDIIESLSPDGGLEAAKAIMTTDTVPKTIEIKKDNFTIGGIAKGAAMLEPNMATMLAVITTDAEIDSSSATEMLQDAVSTSFNCLTVDGAESTNDTVLLLASGESGPTDKRVLAEALKEACKSLAIQMADDAEGSTKTVFLTVTGAATDTDALKGARDTANCQLVKCSWYGEDPYWGRIAAEMGAADITFDPETITISYGDQVVYANGEAQTVDQQLLKEHMSGRKIKLDVDLGQGFGTAQIVTTDLSHEYIDENMRTS
ncbi:MAG: Arginine biosynthesis bifunctional protein ArgJ [Acidimicrobiales bacterium AG-410-I20]|nr:MAG: Arginine biosynthesis bifunctional protein ArgJ [Acidimicrobiales bacterium AG-410-I20]